MFINLSNHPSKNWSEEQLTAAKSFGEIKDIVFPNVSPAASESAVEKLAFDTVESFPLSEDLTVHVMGEMTLTYAIVSILKARGIRCVASTTERIVTDNPDGTKTTAFKFFKFREY